VSDLGLIQLKNIAEQVHVYSLDVRQPAEPKPASPPPGKPAPPRLSLVVLPFANIGGDPEQDYFADGVTESLTSDLSRISGALVIARNTASADCGAHHRRAAFGPPFLSASCDSGHLLREALCLNDEVERGWATRSFRDVLSPTAT
jgi:hypothetical protein